MGDESINVDDHGGTILSQNKARRKSPSRWLTAAGAAMEDLGAWFCCGCDEDHDGVVLYFTGLANSPEKGLEDGGCGGRRRSNMKLFGGFCGGHRGEHHGGVGSLKRRPDSSDLKREGGGFSIAL